MSTAGSDRIAAALVRRAGSRDDVGRIADGVVALWRDIEQQLTPVVGARGVAALHGRSLFLATRTHPWLGGTADAVSLTMDLESLRACLVTQPAATALAGGVSLLSDFHDLLASMVGPALTERLVRDVWDLPSSGGAAQDTSP